MQISFITQIFKRLKSESPKFFKILQVAFGSLSAILWALNFLISKHYIDADKAQMFVDLLNAVAGGSTGAFIATLFTTTDASLMDDKTKVNVVKDVVENQPVHILKEIN